jgi:hypothetical protein
MQESVQTVPTVGFAVETVTVEHVNFTVWDVGGQVRRIFLIYSSSERAKAVYMPFVV